MVKKKNKSAIERTGLSVYDISVNIAAIKTRREKLKMTQADAASRIGLSTQRWSDLETGRHDNPRVKTMAAVAMVLKCKVDDLLR